MNGADTLVECRICKGDGVPSSSPHPACDEAQGDELVAPCRCRGSVQYCHQRCLIKWLQGKVDNFQPLRCELCGYPYKVCMRRLSLWRSNDPLCIGMVKHLTYLLLANVAGALVRQQNTIVTMAFVGIATPPYAFAMASKSAILYAGHPMDILILLALPEVLFMAFLVHIWLGSFVVFLPSIMLAESLRPRLTANMAAHGLAAEVPMPESHDETMEQLHFQCQFSVYVLAGMFILMLGLMKALLRVELSLIFLELKTVLSTLWTL
eukprot:Sspe_Gene.80365::Locus_50719_Transcript_1_1_Confidence_1.000_Length_824::g.80365::m.80365